jgi:hypothetical protein
MPKEEHIPIALVDFSNYTLHILAVDLNNFLSFHSKSVEFWHNFVFLSYIDFCMYMYALPQRGKPSTANFTDIREFA